MVHLTASIGSEGMQAAEKHLHSEGLPQQSMTSPLLSSTLPSSASSAVSALTTAVASRYASLPAPARAVIKVVLLATALMVTAFCLLYTFHHGFRRTVQFWSSTSPIIARYYLLKWKHRYLLKTPHDVWTHQVLGDFHLTTAPRIVDIVARMGGIYVKIGQFLATVGATLLDDAYVQALKPLQDGIPPRSTAEIATILEQSLGRPIDAMFESFDAKPIGAASIAQAHRATLKQAIQSDDGMIRDVVVKVQYPDVAHNYEADFDNLELVVRLLQPEQLNTIRTLRQRHIQELDFRTEAQHLEECAANLQRHRLEPQRVRIPRVVPHMVTREVLVMEFLQGTSLKDAMEEELDGIAAALGMESGQALRAKMVKNLKQHFLDGGGGATDMMSRSDEQDDAVHGTALMAGGSIGDDDAEMRLSQPKKQQRSANTMMRLGKVAAPILRGYASTLRRVQNMGRKIQNGASRVGQIATLGQWKPRFVDLEIPKFLDLDRVIKTLVMVHGVQVILDGVYNADPHPGNVILMQDGRLGLIDYGMVGRLARTERELIASSILAFQRGDDRTVIDNYRDSGYLAGWITNGRDHDDAVYKRFATFHLDRIDLSPIVMQNGDVWGAIDVLSNSVERHTPDWIEQMKRIGGLMIGTASQAGRPISLSKAWKPMARRFMESQGDEDA